MLIRTELGQGKCSECQSNHFNIELDEHNNIIEVKCCRCGLIDKIDMGVVVLPKKAPQVNQKKSIEDKVEDPRINEFENKMNLNKNEEKTTFHKIPEMIDHYDGRR